MISSKISVISLFVFTAIVLAIQTPTASAHSMFTVSTSGSTWCTDCCGHDGCVSSSSYSLTGGESKTVTVAAQASCSGCECDCYSSGALSTFADITIISKKGKQPVIVNCTGSSATSITLNFLKPLKDKNGTYWPYPFDGNCANNTDALKQINGQKLTAVVPSCPFGKPVIIAAPNCVSSNVGCHAVIKDYPTEDALILAVSATFPGDASHCTHGEEGEGSVSCTVHPG